ncbi:MAG: hypothetical protein K8S56_03660 [Candidatus Cloacimonetes bacterium]|nr:hypothetical protein [Candidatus Cloacimonadota bacterium]
MAKLLNEPWDIIYSCGPIPMMKAVRELARDDGIAMEVSLEEYMACGIGACYGCVVRVRGNNGEEYKRVCKEGLVFDAEVVIWS